mmetsp:Transcript_49191/g.114804  ORF Transcript_49191/g.114804 Transcript_49191/m.114804 type:complete len:227 (-) Transcript_49191:93-773(-)
MEGRPCADDRGSHHRACGLGLAALARHASVKEGCASCETCSRADDAGSASRSCKANSATLQEGSETWATWALRAAEVVCCRRFQLNPGFLTPGAFGMEICLHNGKVCQLSVRRKNVAFHFNCCAVGLDSMFRRVLAQDVPALCRAMAIFPESPCLILGRVFVPSLGAVEALNRVLEKEMQAMPGLFALQHTELQESFAHLKACDPFNPWHATEGHTAQGEHRRFQA